MEFLVVPNDGGAGEEIDGGIAVIAEAGAVSMFEGVEIAGFGAGAGTLAAAVGGDEWKWDEVWWA